MLVIALIVALDSDSDSDTYSIDWLCTVDWRKFVYNSLLELGTVSVYSKVVLGQSFFCYSNKSLILYDDDDGQQTMIADADFFT